MTRRRVACRLMGLASLTAWALAAGCASQRTPGSAGASAGSSPAAAHAVPPPDSTLPADVKAFLARQPVDEPIPAYTVLRLPEDSFVLFGVAANGDYEKPRALAGALGVWYRGRTGWLPGRGTRSPQLARSTFRVRADDAFLLSPRLADTLARALSGVWENTWAPWVASLPATPVATLVRAARVDGARGAVLAHPRLRRDPEALLALERPGAYDDAWSRAFVGSVRAVGGVRHVSTAVLRRLVDLLPGDPRSTGLAFDLLRDPRVRASDSLLFALLHARGATDAGLAREATRALLARRPVSDSLFLVLDWWTARPRLIGDRRVRTSVPVLRRLRWSASAAPRLRERATLLLLRNAATDAGTILEIADEVAGGQKRCRPAGARLRRLSLQVLDHPRAREDARIPSTLAYVQDDSVRSQAERLLHRPVLAELPREQAAARRRTEEVAIYRGATSMVATHLAMSEGAFVDSARAVLDRWARRRPPPPEVAEWRRVLAETPDPDSLAVRMLGRDTLMARLRRRSPFLELLPPLEAGMLAGVGCDRYIP